MSERAADGLSEWETEKGWEATAETRDGAARSQVNERLSTSGLGYVSDMEIIRCG